MAATFIFYESLERNVHFYAPKPKFCDSYTDSARTGPAHALSGARLGVIDFRALLQLAPAGAPVASAGAELCPRDKLFGFVAAVARSGPLLTSGRLGPRMQSF